LRSFGLVAFVVAAIFAAAFGVYQFLGGGLETEPQVATPVAPASEPLGANLPGETAADADRATADTPNTQEDQVQSDQVQSDQAESNQTESNQAVSDQTGTRMPAAETGAAEPSGASGQTEQAASANRDEAAPAKDTRAPLVVARSDTGAVPEAVRKPAGPVPTFDVVRVEKSGEAVLAGRAPAGSEVTVLDGDMPLGIVTADSQGQWVLVLEVPLLPGSHSFGITARQPDQPAVESANLVIVAVPEPQPDLQAQNQSADQEESQQQQQIQSRLLPQRQTNGDTETASDEVADNALPPSQVAVAPMGITEPIAIIVPRSGTAPSRILQQPKTDRDGIGSGSLFLDSVDYDDEGRAVLGGRAVPGSKMIIYLDNLPVGEALSDDDGRWAMVPENLVPAGLHQLRVDQIESGGQVLARVETPFSRAEKVTSHPDENFVTVQPGNSLWRIARATFGEGTRYSVIYETNKDQIRDPDLIYPGQIFRLPSGG
jgi:nucleoid-associated protein YgaU